jgi:hypothetical protein
MYATAEQFTDANRARLTALPTAATTTTAVKKSGTRKAA